MKLKDGYKKLIGTSYNGDISLVLLSNGGNLGYAISSTASTLVLRNTNGLIESSLTDKAPFKITSAVVNTNLNADLLDGVHKEGLLTTFENINDADHPLSIKLTVGGTTKYVLTAYSTNTNLAGILGNSTNANYPLLFTSVVNTSTTNRAYLNIYTDTANSLYYNPDTNTLGSPNIVATISVTTPLVSSTGRLTLNATSTGVDLKLNNDNTKSVILNGTEFKPFDDANGNLDLGASDARWKVIYGGSGNFVGNVESTLSDATYVSHIVQNSNGAVGILAATNRGLYDATNSAWIIYLSLAADHVYVPKWASRGSSTLPIYFNADGEPIACTAYSGLLTALSSTSETNLSITVGGTTKSVTDLYARKLALSSTTITSTTNDTTAKWGPLGTSVHFYSTTGLLTNLPNLYGLLLNVTTGSSEVHLIWMALSSGNLYHRGGNSTGWSGSWKTILDSSNYTSYTDDRYIKKSGDTLSSSSALIQRAGSSTSLYLGRSNAMIKINSYSGYNAIASLKTTDGDWSLGVYTNNVLCFTYVTDTNFNAGTNTITALIYMNPSGYLYATHFYESSDINLKTNIKIIDTSDNIPQLKEFDWKKDGTHGYGLIAQELEAMGYSELVDGEEDGYKTVNYSAALSLIVGKLQVKIKELEKEIEILKNKN